MRSIRWLRKETSKRRNKTWNNDKSEKLRIFLVKLF